MHLKDNSIVFRYFLKPLFGKTPEQGAQTIIQCVVDPDLKPGAFYKDCVLAQESSFAKDQQSIDKLWKVSEKYVGL
jgi:hypothetical protein